MNEPGPLIASGRDADIFEYGASSVLRRSRDRRSLVEEGRIMTYVREHGYPVPEVHELSDDGAEMVMERIAGPTMIELLSSDPSTLLDQAAELRRLHERLHEIPIPSWLPISPFGDGESIIHLDLHPINVIVSDRGPVVIDWARASRGDAKADVALTWLLTASGDIPGEGEVAELMSLGRAMFIDTFLEGFDRTALRTPLATVVEWKLADPHMSPTEKLAMRQLLLDTR
jgi:aminoglycoside phosphotransferase (APT) family kinase protein